MLINLYATLRQVTGGKTVSLDVPPGSTVQVMLESLLKRFPDLRRHLYAPDGVLYPHVHVFVNGRDAQYLAHGLDTPLAPADTINIFPPVGGG
jgi:MoaD family protein